MKFIKFILKVLLPIIILTVTFGFALENITIKAITEDIMSKKVSDYIADNVVNDLDIDTLEELENEIRTSKYVENITAKYVDIIINNLIYDKKEKLNIENEIDKILENEYFGEMTEGKKVEIKNNLKKCSVNLEEKLEENLTTSFNNYNFMLILKVYEVFTNTSFRIIMLLSLMIDMILLILLEKAKALKSIQIGIFVVSIISLIIFIILKLILASLEQQLFGGWINNVNLNVVMLFIIAELMISTILCFIRKRVYIKK